MEPQTIIARRIARELSPGMLVNLGIGIPTLVANYVPAGMHVFFQSENGLIGTGAPPEEGMAHPDADRRGRPPGHRAARRQHVRQRHVVRPHSRRPSRPHGARRPAGRSVGTARQLDDPRTRWCRAWAGPWIWCRGAKRVIVAMQHTAKGASKIVKTMLAADHVDPPGGPGRHRAGGDRISRRPRDPARDRPRRFRRPGDRSDRGRARHPEPRSGNAVMNVGQTVGGGQGCRACAVSAGRRLRAKVVLPGVGMTARHPDWKSKEGLAVGQGRHRSGVCRNRRRRQA